jgi:antitoxin CptB
MTLQTYEISVQQLQSKKRLYWQCRRGMLELEIFLKEFLDNDYDDLDTTQKQLFEQLLMIIDPVLFDYLMGMDEPDNTQLREMVLTIREATRKRVNA